MDGQSLLKIAESLNERQMEYMPGTTGWNKARLKRIIPTKKAEALRPSILAHIRQSETQLTTDISEADVLTCKKVLCQMLYNVSEHKEVCKKNE